MPKNIGKDTKIVIFGREGGGTPRAPLVDAPFQIWLKIEKLHAHRSLSLKFQLSSSFHMSVPHSQSFGRLRSETFPPPFHRVGNYWQKRKCFPTFPTIVGNP